MHLGMQDISGIKVPVAEGNFAGSVFTLSTTNPIVVGTTNLTFTSTSRFTHPANGGSLNCKSISEEITISVGNGTSGVASSSNLIPAGSMFKGCVARITQAPGGGATTIDAGITANGNSTALISGGAVALGTSFSHYLDGDGSDVQYLNKAAATIYCTTDSDVTGSDMKIRITVFYDDLTPPSS
jgi:hypothetical protein